MKPEIYSFDRLYKCECDSHYLRVTQFTGEPQISFSKFYESTLEISFFRRVKLAIGYIFNPAKYDINGDIIFDVETSDKLAKDLLSITKNYDKHYIKQGK